MAQKKYRVIQWCTGVVGSAALKHFIENPVIELVGVLVTNPDKVGKDAGDLVGLPKTGVLATNDVEKIIALEADGVHFAPIVTDVDMICRLLRSGKNVASVAGPFVPNKWFQAESDKIEAACRDTLQAMLEESAKLQADALANLAKAGVKIEPWPEAVLAALRSAWAEVAKTEGEQDYFFKSVLDDLDKFRGQPATVPPKPKISAEPVAPADATATR